MKAFCVIATVGLTLLGSMGSASAQPYGDRYYGNQDRDYEYRERPRFRDRNYEYRERPVYGERRTVFDEGEYLRCHRDVRRAVFRGEFESGFEHYQRFGRREGRRLSC